MKDYFVILLLAVSIAAHAVTLMHHKHLQKQLTHISEQIDNTVCFNYEDTPDNLTDGD